jgi:hypothetical protein
LELRRATLDITQCLFQGGTQQADVGRDINVESAAAIPLHPDSAMRTAMSSRCQRRERRRKCFFFLAIVRNRDGGVSYFTFERAVNDGAMLCAWDAEGAHLNYGERPLLNRDGFVAEVAALRR